MCKVINSNTIKTVNKSVTVLVMTGNTVKRMTTTTNTLARVKKS